VAHGTTETGMCTAFNAVHSMQCIVHGPANSLAFVKVWHRALGAPYTWNILRKQFKNKKTIKNKELIKTKGQMIPY